MTGYGTQQPVEFKENKDLKPEERMIPHKTLEEQIKEHEVRDSDKNTAK